jgi:undecaprenyl-diphosphatase
MIEKKNNKQPIECNILGKIQKKRNNIKDYFWKFWSFFGLPYFWVGTGIVFYFLDFIFVFILFIIVGLSHILIILPLKFILKRKRPVQKCENIRQLVNVRSFSFPSGHVYTTMVFGLVVALYFNGLFLLICMVSLGVMVAISRLYLGVHYLTDVIFSFILAIIVVLFVFNIIAPLIQVIFLEILKKFGLEI